jgi:heptosyltransferase-2
MMSHLNHLGTNILLRSPNWLGDAVMTLPAVQFLRTQLPAATHLTVLTPTKLADFWRLVPGLHSVLRR